MISWRSISGQGISKQDGGILATSKLSPFEECQIKVAVSADNFGKPLVTRSHPKLDSGLSEDQERFFVQWLPVESCRGTVLIERQDKSDPWQIAEYVYDPCAVEILYRISSWFFWTCSQRSLSDRKMALKALANRYDECTCIVLRGKAASCAVWLAHAFIQKLMQRCSVV